MVTVKSPSNLKRKKKRFTMLPITVFSYSEKDLGPNLD